MKDIYVEIMNILTQDLSYRKTADLLKKLFDKCNDDMLKLIIETARRS